MSSNKSKIYLIGPTESILTKRGNRFPNIASYLVEIGEEVIYYTSNFYHAEKRFFTKGEMKEGRDQINYPLVILKTLGYSNNISPKRVLNNFLFSLTIFFKLLIVVKKNDRIFLPSRPVELIYFVSLLKRLKGNKIYLDIQDIWPDALEIENNRKKRVFEFYCNAYLKPALKHYTSTIHTAPTFKKWLNRYTQNISSKFIPLGWENSRWRGFHKKLENNKNQIKLVCIAQLQHQIDVMPILHVLKDHKNYHLTIIGEDGNGERYPAVIEFIETNSINNIDIIGKVKREEMQYHLEYTNIGILPMITPSIPNKIFDYIAAELPIIVLGDNDSSDFVNKYDIGWSCPFDSLALFNVLEELNFDSINEKVARIKNIKYKFSRNELHKEIKEILN